MIWMKVQETTTSTYESFTLFINVKSDNEDDIDEVLMYWLKTLIHNFYVKNKPRMCLLAATNR